MSDPMTPEGRAELRKLLAKATDRPWIAEYSGPTGNCVIPHDAQSTLEAVAFTRLLPAWHDAELIAAAVNALPALLDALEQASRDYEENMRAGLRHKHRAEQAEAALDRVRSFIDDPANRVAGEVFTDPDAVLVDDLRASLDGTS